MGSKISVHLAVWGLRLALIAPVIMLIAGGLYRLRFVDFHLCWPLPRRFACGAGRTVRADRCSQWTLGVHDKTMGRGRPSSGLACSGRTFEYVALRVPVCR